MLVQLFIQDIVLIDKLDIEFVSGMSVLTGETGAGKSILLDALSLAIGARGDGDLVRSGADNGQVRAVFALPVDHRVFDYLHENDILERAAVLAEGGVFNLILRRVQSSDGRTRAFVNDVPVAVAQQREIGRMLVEIHGQHDERALVDGDKHRNLLDAFGGLAGEVQQVAEAWKSWNSILKELTRLEVQILEAGREADYLRSSVSELEKLAPMAGEETELADQRQMMMNAQNIAGDLSQADDILSGNGSPAPVLASLARKLERKKQQVPGLLEGVVEQLDSALHSLYSAQNELAVAINKSEYDPQALDNVEERLFALRAAARKYNVSVEHLPEVALRMTEQLASLDSGEERLAMLKSQSGEREAIYRQLADDLTIKRSAAGKTLTDKVSKELPSLKLEQAEFLIEHQSHADFSSAQGCDKIEFRVRTNPGTKAGPMFKVASGGELSRFLLALKVVLAEKGSAPTLIFDEIDTGVGGAVADAIGQRLSRLSKGVQVLSVTHAPQVAAKAVQHYLISKASLAPEDKRVATAVVEISGDTRQNEIARMLSGATITREALAAANRLLDPTQ